jgi:indolepyruvate ferredoxin oxidoreductase beta subunit
MADKEFSVYMCGVGGQGLVLLSNVIGSACALSGIRAITGEQHGLSQRSGSINIHMRIGKDVRSPLIPIGGADAILALEALEALRYVEYLRPGGVVVMNSRVQHPIIETGEHVRDKSARYMDAEVVKTRLLQVTDKIATIDALGIARKAGNALTENVVMLGAMSTLDAFPVPDDAVEQAIKDSVPKKAVEVNLKAFKMGRQEAHGSLCNIVKCRKGFPEPMT